jgi:hypothetical protein
MRDYLRKHFLPWMHSELLTVIVRHVHEVERKFYSFPIDRGKLAKRRKSSFFMELVQDWVKQANQSSKSPTSSTQEKDLTRVIADQDDNELDVVVESRSSKRVSRRASAVEEVSDGEIRNVIVMFIKIDKLDARLHNDLNQSLGDRSRYIYHEFAFLNRTEKEIETDELLLLRFQKCFQVLCGILMDKGGQLRQFIVDDKGTVCIGTFGLRGSAAVDNAAQALEAALLIIEGLKEIQLSASIGITSGKAYCGLVGSSSRHEYAVMGPSTNLSARLMCKAPAHGVICDADTVERDRTHNFEALAEVQAKGYANPVMTYKPAITEVSGGSSHRGQISRCQSHRGQISRSASQSASTKRLIEVDVHNSSKTGVAKITAVQRLHGILKSDFIISQPKLRKNSVQDDNRQLQQHRLHGRDMELAEIFNFLFINDAANLQRLSYTSPTRMISINANPGTGKSSIVNTVEKKLTFLSKSDQNCNLLTHIHHTNSIHRDVAFGSLKLILPKLLRLLHKSYHPTKQNNYKPIHSIDTLRNDVDADNCAIFDFVWSQMPVNLQSSRFLFLSIVMPSLLTSTAAASEIEPELDATSGYQLCVKLFTALISLIPKITKQLLVLIM